MDSESRPGEGRSLLDGIEVGPELREGYAAAHADYERAARAWRGGSGSFEEVLDAFGKLARATTAVVARVEPKEEAIGVYVDGREPGQGRAVMPDSPGRGLPVQVSPYTEEYGLGTYLVARDEFQRIGEALEELARRGGFHHARPALTGHEEKTAIAERLAFEELPAQTGRAREWTRGDYDRYVLWSEAERDLAHVLGYGPARDRVTLAEVAFERALGRFAHEVTERLAFGRISDRLPRGTVSEYVGAVQAGDKTTAARAARVLDEHVSRLVAEAEWSFEAARRSLAEREAGMTARPSALDQLRELGEVTRRVATFVTESAGRDLAATAAREIGAAPGRSTSELAL